MCAGLFVLEASSSDAPASIVSRCCKLPPINGRAYVGFVEAQEAGRTFASPFTTSSLNTFVTFYETFRLLPVNTTVRVTAQSTTPVTTTATFELSLDIFIGFATATEDAYADRVEAATYGAGSPLWFSTAKARTPTNAVLVARDLTTPESSINGQVVEVDISKQVLGILDAHPEFAGLFISVRATAYDLPDCLNEDCQIDNGYSVELEVIQHEPPPEERKKRIILASVIGGVIAVGCIVLATSHAFRATTNMQT